MTRKSKLIQTIGQYLDYDNKGTFKQRQLRRFVLNKIIEDFYCLRAVPPTWYALQSSHVMQLVNLWKKNGLKNATIMNYLVCLRYFLKKIDHPIEGIENASLNLVKSRKTAKPQLNRDDILSCLNDPIARVLFALQSYFGLTLSEAMRWIPAIHVDNNELWITREISSNSKDRVTPIQSTQQQLLIVMIKDILNPDRSLLNQFGEAHVRLVYRYALKTIGLSTNIQYRFLYAKARLHELRNDPRKLQLSILKREMGINATSTVWSYCHEQG